MESAMAQNLQKSSYNELLLTSIDILFCEDKVSHIQKFFSRFWFSLRSQLSFGNSRRWEENKNQESESSNQQHHCGVKRDDKSLCREEVEMVMGKLGLFCSPEGEKLNEFIGFNELSGLFNEEPSLEEVKEAFNVFDENTDGFIDAKELQIVLCRFGLKEGFELENCRNMIRAYDQNGDGKIDFSEFVKFMENSFS
ncbi:hypothetical protein JCGZ_13047 [Jatropha curcas]|uniref:EF-hand domain-containing protein n=1 Tax=Jatropha curcas TaxID=180498 RepID=A0A067K9U4_JATCU|nr:probable calcium-binding protein CML46 [Jatropha curcas]KDP33016.1 hypothetical protein JCGZ_13047 [Jatropha curcas]